MTLLASAIFLVLLGAAMLHAAWAFGMVWPAKDEQGLVDTVIGTPELKKMPGRALTLAVAAGIAAAGFCALWSAGTVALPLPDWVKTAATLTLLLIFALRGLATYFAGSRWLRSEPFASLDRRYFAPLCLFIALGFGLILLNG